MTETGPKQLIAVKSSRRDWLIVGLLASLTFLTFYPATRCNFVNLDDYLLSLLCKSMLAASSSVLLVLDFWPRGRLGAARNANRSSVRQLVAEKIILAFPAVVLTMISAIGLKRSGVLAMEHAPVRAESLTRPCRMDNTRARYFAIAVPPSPGSARCHNNPGVALAQLENLDSVVQQFELAMRLDPGYQGAKDNGDRMRAERDRHRLPS